MIMVEVTVLLKGFSFGCLGECNQSRVFDAPEFANLLGDYENFHLMQAISPSTHGSVMSVDHKEMECIFWRDAVAGRPDWRTIFNGYASAVDWPAASFYRELHAFHADAKFVLTVRSSQSWAESFSETIYKNIADPSKAPPSMQDWPKMVQALLKKTGVPMGLDVEQLKCAFDAHTEAVKAAIPPNGSRQSGDTAEPIAGLRGETRLGASLRVPRSPRSAIPVSTHQRTRRILGPIQNLGESSGGSILPLVKRLQSIFLCLSKTKIFERAAVRSTDRTGSSRKGFSKLILVSNLSRGRCPHELRVATKSRSFQRVRPAYNGTRC